MLLAVSRDGERRSRQGNCWFGLSGCKTQRVLPHAEDRKTFGLFSSWLNSALPQVLTSKRFLCADADGVFPRFYSPQMLARCFEQRRFVRAVKWPSKRTEEMVRPCTSAESCYTPRREGRQTGMGYCSCVKNRRSFVCAYGTAKASPASSVGGRVNRKRRLTRRPK